MSNYNIENNNLLVDGKFLKFNTEKAFINKNNSKNETNNCLECIKSNKKIILFIIICLILFASINYIFLFKNKTNIPINKQSNLKFSKNYFLYKYINNFKSKLVYFKIMNTNFTFSLQFNVVKIEYDIGFYENINKLIPPSEIKPKYNLKLICHMNIKNIGLKINSIPNIYNDTYIRCIEFFKLDEKVDFGIKIYLSGPIIFFSTIYIFNEQDIFSKELIHKNESLFNPLIINEEYDKEIEKIYDTKIGETLKLKKSYTKYPICSIKRNVAVFNDKWYNNNLYGHYFCFCKGEVCLLSKISQKCKYKFYLNVIDNNRDVYPKTHYIFVDFIFNDKSFDDTYPVFQEMAKEYLPVHYVTENMDIYKEYCFTEEFCDSIIRMNEDEYELYGDFLEKYLTLLLQLKSVVSGKISNTNHFSDLFYNMEYVTYICVGHGVCYFKDYLYTEDRLYGQKRNDKILLPPSDKIINIAKKYGWKDENIIKLNLPRWDKYNVYNASIIFLNKSIFVMFTWRAINDNQRISSYYIKNIIDLLTNDMLTKKIKLHKLILYFAYHRFIPNSYFNSTKSILRGYKHIKIIQQKEISHVLSQASLVVSDFSSIIFEMVYRRKPFIFYVPDIEDPNLKTLYTDEYYELINSIRNGKIEFENKCMTVNQTIDKMIYYINNNFQIDDKLKEFYDSFSFKKENNIKQFVDYLKSLK